MQTVKDLSGIPTVDLEREIDRRKNKKLHKNDLTDDEKKLIKKLQNEMHLFENKSVSFSMTVAENLFLQAIASFTISSPSDFSVDMTIDECRLSPLNPTVVLDEKSSGFLETVSSLLLEDYEFLYELVADDFENFMESASNKFELEKELLIAKIAKGHSCDPEQVEDLLFHSYTSFTDLEV